VLECLSGYLLLGQGLLEGNAALADSFNFGPAENDTLSVAEIARRIVSFWPEARFQAVSSDNAPHEARLLALDCAKSRATLRWQPVWDVDTALERTVAWYRSFYEQKTATTHEDLDAYVNTAQKRSLVWA
jgi:CDP-glucose 4,6-dehydratase